MKLWWRIAVVALANGAPAAMATETTTYTYDSFGRLNQSSRTVGTSVPVQSTIVQDVVDNRASVKIDIGVNLSNPANWTTDTPGAFLNATTTINATNGTAALQAAFGNNAHLSVFTPTVSGTYVISFIADKVGTAGLYMVVGDSTYSLPAGTNFNQSINVTAGHAIVISSSNETTTTISNIFVAKI